MENLILNKQAARLMLDSNGLEDYKLPIKGRTLCCNIPYGKSFMVKKIDNNVFEFCYV